MFQFFWNKYAHNPSIIRACRNQDILQYCTMFLAKVIRPLWSTKKHISLAGLRILEVEKLASGNIASGHHVLVFDTIGAGVGETVMCTFGSIVRDVVLGETVAGKHLVTAIIDPEALTGLSDEDAYA
jgi:ethanolamine utilization protein EutN